MSQRKDTMKAEDSVVIADLVDLTNFAFESNVENVKIMAEDIRRQAEEIVRNLTQGKQVAFMSSNCPSSSGDKRIVCKFRWLKIGEEDED